MSKKLTYKFVKEQIEKEGYKLLSTEYKNIKTKLKIKCDNGHEYESTWNKFQQGNRCFRCYHNKRIEKVKLTYKFVKEQIEKEGYKLLSTEYINAHIKLKVKCPKGHEYESSYNNFKKGSRCPVCFGKQKHSYKFVKEQIEKEGYKLLSKGYKNAHTKLKVKCNKGHEYNVIYNDFQQGNRCPFEKYIRSSKTQRYNYEFIKEQIEKEGYKLLSEKYKNNRNKIKIQCPFNHEYNVRYENFQQGRRCPICAGKQSKAEKEISSYLKSLNIEVIENDRELIKPYELDIVIPEHKLAIEYCGLYWHSEKYKDKNYHKNKLELSNKAGYRLITIFEDEWVNKKEIIKNRLKHFLGLNTERIYARKCIIKEISKEQSKNFTDKYHIQGHANSTIYFGAFYYDKLVAINTFIKRGLIYELNRFCMNNNIIGIASKFIKYFQKKYKYNKIVTFADRRWSEGKLYEVIGFKKDKILYPDYTYFKYNGEILRYHKFGFRHNQMKNKLENYNSKLSEKENMINNDWLRIYDCGKIRYVIEDVRGKYVR